MLGTFLPGAQHLQNFHPVVVHYPIAFLTGAALFYILAWVTRRDTLAYPALWQLLLGTAAAAVAVGTGLFADKSVTISASVRENLLNPHEWLMLSMFGLSVILAMWAIIGKPFPKKGRWLFIVLFLLLLGIMVVGADFGGRMVYDYNVGGSACSQPVEFTK